MLCYSINGFSETTSLRVGDSFTIVAPESFVYSSNTYVIKQYIWSSLDASYFDVEYSELHSYSHYYNNHTYYSEGINVAKVTLKHPFQGTIALTCTATGWYNGMGSGATRNQTYTYTFTCAPVNITLLPSVMNIDAGQSQTLQWQFSPSSTQYGATVSFSSSDADIADVDFNGKITAKSAGTTTITATTNYFTTATCEVTVNPILATSISLNKSSMSIPIGSMQTLTATVLPSAASNKSVTWTSSNQSIATVDSNGKVTAKAIGNATITATTNDGSNLSASCAVTVTQVTAASIQLNQTEVEMSKGESLRLTATVLPTGASQRVTWSSSDPNVARVVGGTVYAQDMGECLITARTLDGTNLTADCLIMVYPEQQPSVGNGDVDGDGRITIADVAALIDFLLNN